MSESGDKNVRYIVEVCDPGWKSSPDKAIFTNAEAAEFAAKYFVAVKLIPAARVVEMRVKTFHSR